MRAVIEWVSDALEAFLPAAMGIACILALLDGNLPLMWFLLVLMLVIVAVSEFIESIEYRRNGRTEEGCKHE